jgi:apurinic endonuclease APN1
MDALQVFSAPPAYYNERVQTKPERVERFRSALQGSGISPARVIVHAGYVLNVSSPDEEKWERSAAALVRELERSTALGVGGVCFHPGSAGGGAREDAMARIVLAMRRALAHVDGSTRLLVENTAGGGNTMARTAAEVGAMLAGIPQSDRARTGYGLDTCHLFASGYDIAGSREQLLSTLDEFEGETGESPSFFHVNDSSGALGSNRDRHALIGDGCIGEEPFRWLIGDPRARGIPLIFETPQANPDIGDDDDSPDSNDVRMMELLRSLDERRG